jgi:hypothetical protein
MGRGLCLFAHFRILGKANSTFLQFRNPGDESGFNDCFYGIFWKNSGIVFDYIIDKYSSPVFRITETKETGGKLKYIEG